MKSNSQHQIFDTLIVPALLFAVIYVSFFSSCTSLGLYEDDYYYIAKSVNYDSQGILRLMLNHFTSIDYNQGRFLGFTLSFFLPWLTYQIGGGLGLYLGGCVLLWAVGYVFYRILRYHFSPVFALIGTFIFVLYPADTTKSLLIHLYQLHLSLLWTVLAIYFYLRKPVFLCYLFSVFSLVTYENAFLPILFVPFLETQNWNRKFFLKFGCHVFLILVIFAILFFVRSTGAEERLAELSLRSLPIIILKSLFVGPIYAGISFVFAGFQVIKSFSSFWFGFTSVFCLFILLFWKILDVKYLDAPSPHSLNRFLKLLLVGIAMLVVAYLFSFTHYPPTRLVGRGTSVHLGSYVGISIVLVTLLEGVFTLIKTQFFRYCFVFSISVILSCLSSYGRVIQKDFADAWNRQQHFVHGLVEQTKQIEDSTIILIDYPDLSETTYIDTYGWAFPEIYEIIYKFPKQWHSPPKILIIAQDCSEIHQTKDKDDYVKVRYPWMFDGKELLFFDEFNVIIYRYCADSGFEFVSKSIKKTPNNTPSIFLRDLDKREAHNLFFKCQ